MALLGGGASYSGPLDIYSGTLDLDGETLMLGGAPLGGGGLVLASEGTLDLGRSIPDFGEAEQPSQPFGPISGGAWPAETRCRPNSPTWFSWAASRSPRRSAAELESEREVLDEDGMLLVPLRVRFVVDGRVAYFDLWPGGDVTQVEDYEILSPDAPNDEPEAVKVHGNAAQRILRAA